MRTNVGKAILLVFLFLLVFYAAFIAMYFLSAGIFFLISKVQFLAKILAFLFDVRGDSPSFVMPIICAALGYFASTWVIEKTCHDDTSTEKLTLLISGIMVVAAEAFLLVYNIAIHNKFAVIFNCIILTVAGIATIIKSRKK